MLVKRKQSWRDKQRDQAADQSEQVGSGCELQTQIYVCTVRVPKGIG